MEEDLERLSKTLSNQVAIVTTTYYNPDIEIDRLRMELARSALRKAREIGYHVYVVDAGSPNELLRDFESIGVHIETFIEGTPNLAVERKQAFRHAYHNEHRVIAWMEPEKEPYVSEIIKTALPIMEEEADLVVPRRVSMDSYPKLQTLAEWAGNKSWAEMTGYKLDYWFGPKTMYRDIAPMFIDYDCEFGDKWESIHLPVLLAISQEKRVVGVDVDFEYPSQQAALEKRLIGMDKKRMEQLTTLVRAGERYMNHLRQGQ